uniref:Uncharacterized protein n=1 Tax=Anguilla anguilla TaxID=7936 RepID=A0A0E9P7R3_ANGAN
MSISMPSKDNFITGQKPPPLPTREGKP